MDGLFTQAESDLSANQAGALYQQIDQDLWQDMPTLPLLAEPTFVAFSAAMVGVQNDPGGLGPLWGMSQWAPIVPARTSHTKTASRAPAARANMRGT